MARSLLPARRSHVMLARRELAARSALPGRFHASLISSFSGFLIIFVFLPFFATAQQTSFAVGTASAAPSLSVVISQPRVL
jgi:hypothetical protein